MSQHSIDLNTFADGAVAQKVERELEKVIANIHDPNTEADKKRKITITLTLSSDDKREYIDTEVEVKSTLVPTKTASTKMIMGKQNGKLAARELVSGKKDQMFFDPTEGVVKTDVGETVTEDGKIKPVAFKGAN